MSESLYKCVLETEERVKINQHQLCQDSFEAMGEGGIFDAFGECILEVGGSQREGPGCRPRFGWHLVLGTWSWGPR